MCSARACPAYCVDCVCAKNASWFVTSTRSGASCISPAPGSSLWGEGTEQVPGGAAAIGFLPARWRPALRCACPHTWFSRRGVPAASAEFSLTLAALTAAKQQVRPKTSSSRRPMVCLCLWVALPLACGLFMGLELPAEGPFPPGPPSWLAPLQVVYLGPGDSCCFRPGSDWAKVMQACARVREHTCRDGPPFPGWLLPGSPVPSVPVQVAAPMGVEAGGTGQGLQGWGSAGGRVARVLAHLQGHHLQALLPPTQVSRGSLWGTGHVTAICAPGWPVW